MVSNEALRADIAQFLDDGHKISVNLGPINILNEERLTSGSGREKEEIDNAQIDCLLSKLLSSSKDSDDLPIGSQRNIEAREGEFTDNRTTKG